MSAALIKGYDPLMAKARPGTQVLFKWAQWHEQHAFPRATLVAVFRKENNRLVVYQYGSSLCVAVKKSGEGPMFNGFREWRQSFAVIQAKLVQHGWSLETNREEVSHAH